jgi:hypothetical protein
MKCFSFHFAGARRGGHPRGALDFPRFLGIKRFEFFPEIGKIPPGVNAYFRPRFNGNSRDGYAVWCHLKRVTLPQEETVAMKTNIVKLTVGS